MIRAAIAAVLGAVIGAGALVAAHSRSAGLAFEMDAPLPAFISGVYKGERDGDTSFAWTTDRMSVDLRDLDRRSSWNCTLRFRAFRPEGHPAPVLTVLVDDVQVTSMPAAGEFHDLGFSIPAGGRGARLAVMTMPAFTPGPADTRLLGVQVDRLVCRPSGFAWPPGRALMQVSAAAGFAALMFSIMGLSLGFSVAGAAIVAAGMAAMLTIAGGLYSDFGDSILRVVVWVVSIAALASTGANRASSSRLTTAARLVFAISAIAIALKMFGLLHPSKPDIDATFNAHRLEWVMSGKYFFSQPFVGGVLMPYPIGLYVFALPWTWITGDHVALIRGVTTVADVLAGALLYPVVVRAWSDRRAAVLAVLFYQLAPLGYAMLGNANLPNLFGQSTALVVMAAAVSWNLRLTRPVVLVVFAALVAVPFLSHVSSITTLIATLGLLTLLYWWRGNDSRRASAYATVVAVAVALVLSWVIYYRHVSDEIAGAFRRMFSGGGAAAAATTEETARGFMTTGERVQDLLLQAISSAGIPMVLLAAAGVWLILKRGVRGRLESALIAWAGVWVVFSASTVFSRVDPEFVRYTAEFLGRINLATIPLMAILAARGATAGWDESTPAAVRTPLKALSVAMVAWSASIATTALLGWFAR